MKKAEQKKLLWMSGMGQIAGGFIGVFFLFFVKESFALELWQTVAWCGLLQFLFGLLVYPINTWGLTRLGLVRMIGFGLFFEALFFLILALELTSLPSLGLITLCFLLNLALFWPAYNFLTAVATQDKSRGDFLGNLQVIIIFIGILMPILVGWLFDQGQQSKVLWVALFFFVITILLSQRLTAPISIEPKPWSQSWQHLKRIFFDKNRFWGFFPDITDSIMWSMWPLYFQWIVRTFFIMGAITSLVATLEMGTSKVLGKLTDQSSAQKLLEKTVWARVMDLFARSLYLVFSPPWFIAIVQSLGSVLGPAYQIPYGIRLMEIGEEETSPDELFDYWVIREIYLGVGRGIFLLICAAIIYILGPWVMGILIALTGLSTLGARRL